MKVTVGDKVVNVPQDYIDRNMKALDITADEAVALYLDDEGITVNDEAVELTVKAKTAGAGAKATGERVTRKPPVRQPDELKRELIAAFAKSLETDVEQIASESGRTYKFDITNIERMIAFEIGDEKFELTLTKKRKPKK